MIIGLRKTASKNKIRKSNKFLAQYSKEKKSALFLKEKQLKAVILRLLSFYKP